MIVLAVVLAAIAALASAISVALLGVVVWWLVSRADRAWRIWPQFERAPWRDREWPTA